MNSNEIKSLKLLEAIEYDQVQSQRDLADRLGVSLGMVNALIKRLARKGYFKIRTMPKSRVKYLITPKGLAEKSLLTYRYIIYSLSFYREIQARFENMFSAIENEGKQQVILFGKCDLSDIASVVIRRTNLQLIDIIDQVEQIDELAYDCIVVLDLDNQTIIKQRLFGRGVKRRKIVLF